MAEPQREKSEEPPESQDPSPASQAPEAEKKEKEKETIRREIDLVNRDPKNLNSEVITVDFPDVVAEPDSYHTADVIWSLGERVFTRSQPCCYRAVSTLLGLPMALLWGVIFAAASFCQVWAGGPCVRGCGVGLYWARSLMTLCLRPFADPLFHALGAACTGVRVEVGKKS
ncbi:caveolin-3-like [Lepisosteus oculatus]|uniref:caveolin-3-like n=1 Tax=Lepisosteus oculatus TaxID=7918 RepID=UPI0035F51BF3